MNHNIHIYRTLHNFTTEVKMMRITAKHMVCDLGFVAVYAKTNSVCIAFFNKGEVVTMTKPIVKGAASVKMFASVYVNDYKRNNH